MIAVRIRRLIVVAVSVYLVFLVAQLPASLIVPMLESRAAISMSGVSGTLWRGEATHLWFQNRHLGELHWKMRPLYLLLGRYTNRIEINNASDQIHGEGDFALGFDDMRLTSAEIESPVSQLLDLADANLPLEISGGAAATIDKLRWDNEGDFVSADAKVVINDLVVGEAQRLGDFNAVVTLSEGSPFLIDLRSAESSELQLDGTAEVSQDGNAAVDFVFHDISTIGDTGSFIKLITKRDGDRYLLRWKGNLYELM